MRPIYWWIVCALAAWAVVFAVVLGLLALWGVFWH